MSTDPKIPAKQSAIKTGAGKMHEMSRIPGVMPGAAGGAAGGPRTPEKSIMNFDKTGIYQQIVQADSEEQLEHLESRIELIEAIQRVQLLQTLPETALYFLETELKFFRAQPKEAVGKIQRSADIRNLYLVVEGQVMVMGEEAPGRTRVVNWLKKGEFFFDKQFNWAGLPVVECRAVMPTQIIQIPYSTLQKIVKVSGGVRKRLKAISLRMDKRAEKFDGAIGRIWNYLVRNGYSYSERVRVIRLDKCIDCDACYQGCEARHGHARIWKSKNKFGLLMFPDACRTCEFTHCTAHCPGDHIYFDKTYREVVIKDSCTGCTHCSEDCPYGVIKMVEREDDPSKMKAEVGEEVEGDGAPKEKEKEKKKGKAAKQEEEEAPKSDKKKMLAIKCDHCFGHHDMACVTPCPTNAIFDLSQRELFERVDLYGVVGGDVDVEEAAQVIRPIMLEKKPGDRGGLHAMLWSISLMMAAILGWESYAREHLISWSLSYLAWNHLGLAQIAAARGYETDLTPLESVTGLGRWLGWLGSFFLTLTIGYVPRKRLEKLFSRIWSRAAFLDIHVFLGMMGFIFAAYHTTFKVMSNQWAIVFWACSIVVITGIIGRYFYGQVPRTVAGHEMKLEDAKAEEYAIERELASVFPDAADFKEYLDWSIPEEKRNRGLIGIVLLMIVLDLKRNAKLAILRGKLRREGKTRREAREIVATIKKKANLEQKILLYEKSRKITRVWLYVHIAAAVVMFLVLVRHIYYEVELSGLMGDHLL